ncbi:MAG: phosphoribosyltransferase family protein [Lachnospiraceae bacterium]|nr:phosphoribosyltransferase family protein [Lachnospiraceae bacterium]
MISEEQIVGVAKRENNKKRNYLIVNRLQGKHVPVSPKLTFQMFEQLKNKVEVCYKDEQLLLVGFAETATAIGAYLATRMDTLYMQTTREKIAGVEYLYFSEEHSHATEQKLVKDDLDKIIDGIDRIVFVEDEVTTGKTILNIINIIKRQYGDKIHFSVASIINGMNQEAFDNYKNLDIPVHFILRQNNEAYSEVAEKYRGDGHYVMCDTSYVYYDNSDSADVDDSGHFSYRHHCVSRDYQNPRRLVRGAEYLMSCESLFNSIKQEVDINCTGKEILVLGTEELMFPAIFIASKLEKAGNIVYTHSTTRSPIEVSTEEEYPLHNRFELRSVYDDGRVTFIYDLKKYDKVIIITDSEQSESKGINSLINALRTENNDNIELIRWL